MFKMDKCNSKTCDWVKVGDRVKIVDGSWSMVYSCGEMRHYARLPSDWKVIAIGLVLPAESDFPSDWSPNDTIIWNSLNGMTVFIRHHFLEPIDATFVTCQKCGAPMRID